MKTLLEALEILETNLKKGKKFYLVECGICENVSKISAKFHHFEIKQLAQNWKHYSGDPAYPIGKGQDEYLLHKTNETLWKDEQLKLRLNFIKFMKSELAKK
ncbi:hypothetical protein Acj9p206 [Acinetobacter phage Acj9]|uniref:Uncharacterized protein n=1 Tax=Acinetobacter phage Acj9 TaxID=760939 RepID=E5EPZ0_9CAUD|nr:hypothetical protein Acj9p206 [Acinetobacter phage Acj9]ADG60106.1 hypothetical protein Acj9p206 [Acinetobacter phage Acj9]